MERVTFGRRRRESGNSAASEPAPGNRSRSTTPFTLRSQCVRHGSACPEGHGLQFNSRLSKSPRSKNKSPRGSDKPSPITPIPRSNGGLKKHAVARNLEASYHQVNGTSIISSKLAIVTSDYSSGEEEVQKMINKTPPQLPSGTTNHSPLQRSAEKTDYTYAKSYSYRSAVTPERVITMPNMTRRSIEASRTSGCEGDGYCSPDLRATSRIMSSFQSSAGQSSKKNEVLYGTDYDSDYEVDGNAYELKPPPSSGSLTGVVYYYSCHIYSKLSDLACSAAWWLYLIVCYSLLLDSSALQTRGISFIRSCFRRQRKNARIFLLILFLLPLCLFTGGFVFSALRALSFDILDKTSSFLFNPSSPAPEPDATPIVELLPSMQTDSSPYLQPSQFGTDLLDDTITRVAQTTLHGDESTDLLESSSLSHQMSITMCPEMPKSVVTTIFMEQPLPVVTTVYMAPLEPVVTTVVLEQPKPVVTTVYMEQPSPVTTTIFMEPPSPVVTTVFMEQLAPVTTTIIMEQPQPVTTTVFVEQPQPVTTTVFMEQPQPVVTTVFVEQPEPVTTTVFVEQPQPVTTTLLMEQPQSVTTTVFMEQPEPVTTTIVMEQPEPVVTTIYMEPPQPVVTTVYVESVKPDDEIRQLLEIDLESAKEKLAILGAQVKQYQESVSTVEAELSSTKDKLLAIGMDSRKCCDQSSAQVLEKVIDTRWAMLASQMHSQTDSFAEKLASFASLLNDAQQDLHKVLDWKIGMEAKEKSISEELSQLHTELETREKNIKEHMSSAVKNLLKMIQERQSIDIPADVKEQLLVEMSRQIEAALDSKLNAGMSRDQVEEMIAALLAVYDADKTGRSDYALEPAGGVVLSTRCTESYNLHRPRLSIWGISLWSEPNNPRVAIQAGIVPGQCWSFRGFDGYLVIKLSRAIRPSAFTLEHIPKVLAPLGNIESAPKNFTVYGLQKEMDIDGVLLGEYVYDQNGKPLQSFDVQLENPGVFPIVELRIHSNHGNPEYTCLYRFRVHGKVID